MKNFFSAGDLNKKQYWPKNLLMNWYNLTNEALERIEYLKKLDVRLYNEIYNHATCERISFEYGLISLYEKELPTDFVNTLKIQTKQDANANGILKVSLFADMSSLFDSWGV
jgi:hypothetical protein